MREKSKCLSVLCRIISIFLFGVFLDKAGCRGLMGCYRVQVQLLSKCTQKRAITSHFCHYFRAQKLHAADFPRWKVSPKYENAKIWMNTFIWTFILISFGYRYELNMSYTVLGLVIFTYYQYILRMSFRI